MFGKNIITTASCALFLSAAACGERAGAPDTEVAAPTQAAAPLGVIASDEIAGLPAAATGIDFWSHSNVAFNSLIVVASADGLSAYNVEDGSEVSRAPGQPFQGVAISYIGFGPVAAGLAVTFSENDNAFQFFGVDNASRLFLPLDGGPDIRGAVRGFCMGRAAGAPDPTLFVVQKSELTIYNIAPTMNGDVAGVAVNGETGMAIPESIRDCSVNAEGLVLLLADDGEIFRVNADSAFASPFAIAQGSNAIDIAYLGSDAENEPGRIAVLDGETGVIELFDADDGHALGAVRIDEAEGAGIDGVSNAISMGALSANLGGLYRDGAIALGASAGENAVIRMIPMSGVANALQLEATPPANPRGEAPAAPDTDNLIIDLTAPTEE